MFTVRHIENGVDNLYQAERVTFFDPRNGSTEAPDNPTLLGALELRNGDTFITGLWGGMAYVMNEHGSTVARYDLPQHPNNPNIYRPYQGHDDLIADALAKRPDRPIDRLTT